VCPRSVVILQLQKERLAQVLLVEDDDTVKAFLPEGANRPFGVSALPSRATRNRRPLAASMHLARAATCLPLRPSDLISIEL
jgi:hypothetical protein